MNRLLPSLILLGLIFAFGLVAQLGFGQYRLLAAELEALRLEAALLRREAQQPGSSAASDPALLVRGASEAVAQAGLLDFIKSVVEGAGGQVVALQPRPVTGIADDGAVLLRAQFNADSAGLQEALHAIEASKPALLVEGLLLRQAGKPADGAAMRLDATLDLRAYRYPE
ncbi:type II secretion system protein GspM [Ferrovibrio sp.]|uniref:type II secretion system protein GspM n=1 Tax=Ferrovibrio sp. TaxID=1917215 RepID=UPI001B52B9D0|nr:type II secretion system protein GspM [Ferrovibrio sp.]MBP7064736.1 hypothetical protein [Ferrovibrio sp.]